MTSAAAGLTFHLPDPLASPADQEIHSTEDTAFGNIPGCAEINLPCPTLGATTCCFDRLMECSDDGTGSGFFVALIKDCPLGTVCIAQAYGASCGVAPHAASADPPSSSNMMRFLPMNFSSKLSVSIRPSAVAK